MNIKVGDTVKVIAGDDKGSTGKVLKVIRNKNRVIVEGVAMVKKHNKPNSNNPKGGITEKESSIHISNVSLTTKDGETTRVGYRIEDDKKVLYSLKNNEII
jgi:large subunit ribosomal protein L24